MSIFSLFRSVPKLSDYSSLKVDMHAHWLPGIDDGARTMADSVVLIEGLRSLGYKQLIATPHVMSDLYPNTSAGILSRLEEVREAIEKRGLKIELDAAAEYLIDESFEGKIDSGDLLTLPGNRVLVEFSFVSLPVNYEMIFFKLQTKGYRPVLAHPERYLYLHGKPEVFETLSSRGIELQLNMLSLVDHYGKAVRKEAQRLLKENLVKFLGTDLHHSAHLDKLRHGLSSKKLRVALAGQSWINSRLS